MKKSPLVLLVVCSLGLLSACGGSTPPLLPATHFSVSASASAAAGTAFNFTVTPLDGAKNVGTYSGTVHFASTDPRAVLPADTTVAANGKLSFTATLDTLGNQTITATDTVTASITGTSNQIVVAVGPASHLSVVGPASIVAGTSFNFTVTALDAAD